jgi:hypothetical protein
MFQRIVLFKAYQWETTIYAGPDWVPQGDGIVEANGRRCFHVWMVVDLGS